MINRSAVCLLFALGSSLHAQTAPEVSGRVTEESGAPVAMATVEIRQLGIQGHTDAAGNYRLRVPEPRDCALTVTRIGFAPRTLSIALRPGMITRLDVRLQVLPATVDSVVGRAAAERMIDRNTLLRSPGSTVAEALGALAGVIVHESTPGGPQMVSLRGSTAGQVLVLLDGVPINDPFTGAADLSHLRKDQIASIAVLRGSQSARYGSRALAGVIVITSRSAALQNELSFRIGSWHTRAATFGVHVAREPIRLAMGAAARSAANNFTFQLPLASGAQRGKRDNADAKSIDGFLSAEFAALGGVTRVRTSAQAEERGLPGKAFAPSPYARQASTLARAQLDWSPAARSTQSQIAAGYAWQRVRYHDRAPSLGLPYDDTVSIEELNGRVMFQRAIRSLDLEAGAEGRYLRVTASSLTSAAGIPAEVGAFVASRWHKPSRGYFAQAQVRADRSAQMDCTFFSHGWTRNGDARTVVSPQQLCTARSCRPVLSRIDCRCSQSRSAR